MQMQQLATPTTDEDNALDTYPKSLNTHYLPQLKPKNSARDPEGDQDLMLSYNRCLKGGTTSQIGFFELARPIVLRAACTVLRNPEDCEEACQNALILIGSKLSQFRGNNAGQLRAWLRRVGYNQAIEIGRRLKNNFSLDSEVQTDSNQSLIDTTLDVEGSTIISSDYQIALNALTPPNRVILLLRAAGLSYEEMSEKLDIPTGTVRSRLHSARKQFKNVLMERGLL